MAADTTCAAFVEFMRVEKNNRLMRYFSHNLEEDAWCSEKGCELYGSVYTFYGSDINSCLISGPLFFDLDCELKTRAVYKELKRSVRTLVNWFKEWGLEEREIEIYFSGSKGFHVIIPEKVLGIVPSEDLSSVNRALALYLKSELGISFLDTGVYDRRRVLRLPGSVNFKTGLYKIPLSYEAFNKVSLKELKEAAAAQPVKENYTRSSYGVNKKAAEKFLACAKWARHPEAEKESSERKKTAQNFLNRNQSELREPIHIILPCIKAVLQSDCMEGKRNRTAFLVASSLIQAKMPKDSVKELILEWNRRLSNPMHETEAENVVDKAFLNDRKGKNHYGCGVFKSEGLCTGNCNFLIRNLSGKGKNSE